MPKIIELELKPHQCLNEESIREQIRLQFNHEQGGVKLLKKSLDARSRRNIHFKIRAELFAEGELPEQADAYSLKGSHTSTCHVVGFGPAGIFAALELLSLGIKPIVLERGKKVKERRRDLAAINKELVVDPNSNYCFGEGGAGTYSDGKLYTRSKKRGDVQKVLATFVQFGANPNILFEAHPHIGTNKLPAIIENMREFILEHGGEILFDHQLTDLFISQSQIEAVQVNHLERIEVEQLILATGHSARDIYTLLKNKGIQQDLKPFALGVRIEHPQELVDEMQYSCQRGEYLPSASYSLVNQAQGRGVFSFCMCPGGIIAPAATAANETVVNGWSPSKRNGKFANSGLVVQLFENDFEKYAAEKELAGMHFQAEIENTCFQKTGSIKTPAQRVADFIKGKQTQDIGETSYLPGVVSANLEEVLPNYIHQSIKESLTVFGKKLRGYDSNEGVMVAPESRTSSPVRIPREKESLEHIQINNLYPCGEGAGFAGGIVSAAIDGIRCANAIKEKVK